MQMYDNQSRMSVKWNTTQRIYVNTAYTRLRSDFAPGNFNHIFQGYFNGIVPVQHPWRIWVNGSSKSNESKQDCNTTKLKRQRNTKPWSYFMGYTVDIRWTLSLRLVTSQIESIVNHTQKLEVSKMHIFSVYGFKFLCKIRNFTHNFEHMCLKTDLRGVNSLTDYDIMTNYDITKLWYLKSQWDGTIIASGRSQCLIEKRMTLLSFAKNSAQGHLPYKLEWIGMARLCKTRMISIEPFAV